MASVKRKSLHEKYVEEVLPGLKDEYGYKSNFAVPSIDKIVVNMGTGSELRQKETKEKIMADLAMITGQKPAPRAARVSVAGFGIRAGMSVGVQATLRGERMWAFLDKLINVVLPRIRDFRGVSRSSFDKQGNYSIGLREIAVFPEIDLAKVDKTRGVGITIVVSAKSKEQSERLLELIGMPFEKADK